MVPGIQGNISFLVCSGTQLMGSWFLKLLFPPTALRCANSAKLVLNLGGGGLPQLTSSERPLSQRAQTQPWTPPEHACGRHHHPTSAQWNLDLPQPSPGHPSHHSPDHTSLLPWSSMRACVCTCIDMCACLAHLPAWGRGNGSCENSQRALHVCFIQHAFSLLCFTFP